MNSEKNKEKIDQVGFRVAFDKEKIDQVGFRVAFDNNSTIG